MPIALLLVSIWGVVFDVFSVSPFRPPSSFRFVHVSRTVEDWHVRRWVDGSWTLILSALLEVI